MVTVSTRPEPASKMVLEIEVPPAEVDSHFATAYRHVAERTRVPGFRPGKAPRHVIDRFVGRASVVAEAIDHLVAASYDAALDQVDIIPIDQPHIDLDPSGVAEGRSVTFRATVAVRPDVQLGAYRDYPFGLEVPDVTDAHVEQVLAELRDQHATLRPVDERGARKDDIASVRFAGTIDGQPFEGGSADRLPLVIGEGRMVPGWEEHLVGMRIGVTKDFEVTFPADYRVESLRDRTARFEVEMLDLRERILPELDDELARAVADVATLEELRVQVRDALVARAAAEARHVLGDRIIEYATANATVEVPEVMIANEIEIMRDELQGRLAAQRIGLEQYLSFAKQSPEELTAELREPATRRVKSLLVLSAIAEREAIDADDAEIDAAIADQLGRHDGDSRLREYLSSRRGRSYLRMTLRNRKLVDSLIEAAVETGGPPAGAEQAKETT